MTEPTFSVIIPTYDRPQQLAGCLQSLSRLTYPRQRWELIVVNDGGAHSWSSLPPEPAGALRAQRVEIQHQGPAAARNAGARRAQGTHLAFTDDDCRVFPDWLDQMAAGFASGPWHAIGGRCLAPEQSSHAARTHQYLVDFLYQYLRVRNGDPYLLLSNNAAYRRSIFEDLGGFDEAFRLAAGEDRELSHRLLARGHRQAHWPKALSWHLHLLTWGSYVQLQFRYGRGDDRFRRALHRQGLGRQIGQGGGPALHWALAQQLWHDRASPGTWLLLGTSQAAHRAGSLYERLRRPAPPFRS